MSHLFHVPCLCFCLVRYVIVLLSYDNKFYNYLNIFSYVGDSKRNSLNSWINQIIFNNDGTLQLWLRERGPVYSEMTIYCLSFIAQFVRTRHYCYPSKKKFLDWKKVGQSNHWFGNNPQAFGGKLGEGDMYLSRQ